MFYYVNLYLCGMYLYIYIFLFNHWWRFFIVCVNIIYFLLSECRTFGVLTFPLFFLSLPFSFKINWHVFIIELHLNRDNLHWLY